MFSINRDKFNPNNYAPVTTSDINRARGSIDSCYKRESDGVWIEWFESPFWRKSRSAAQRVLDDIRLSHPMEAGWYEARAEIQEREGANGTEYRAVRCHYKLPR